MNSAESFLTLGMESSCDDTAVAVLRGPRKVESELLSSQIDDHAPFGGVVPEFAARRHLEAFLPLTKEALRRAGVSNPREEIGLVAVTSGPGLMGSLLVGVMAAKALALAWDIPLIGVNHLEGHIFANVVSYPDLAPPFLCMIVSGGHTEIVLAKGFGEYLMLGGTRDDAAGEAYDKVAKALGLPYPGGPVVDRLASGGDPRSFDFPVPLKGSSEIEFSFSGLKTAAITRIKKMEKAGVEVPVEDFCASFQRAVTEALMNKLRLASRRTGIRTVSISGGVAANSALRAALRNERRWRVCIPPRDRCTDNAVMIAAAGYAAFLRGERSSLDLAPDPSWEIWKK
ncbi:MAG: tRNA (adenosine(37)-N6)-threonylcarbamoyltransferase complex transferase subunit TsaD [Synergistaceae bacterium]|nr:tRNA (adenosine(37)-N6)-threonylcarbamoyltransferase complex transferase subunit TsaD [Synergistota bacterium]NLM71779.1 tRNA (adenosine(37)-N6)-threonylcarbamoyltransferase complex transferase subunit TsaD [Synergistaceae bacterium]